MTASPRLTSPRIASWSRVIETRLGSKPAARQARTISPSVEAAVQSVVGEVGEAHSRASGERVIRGERDPEPLPEEVATLEAGRLATGLGAVLEAHREVQLTGSDARGQVVGNALVDGDLGVGVLEPHAGDGGGDEHAERGGERADAQPRALAVVRRRRAALSASWKRSAMASACSSRISPSRVSRRPPGSRSSSRAPISRSSAATWLETDG